ncbi:MAG: MoaD/ThiS family protein [Phycisphaerales bacterium]|nr:MoaD/ThiS family protein [Phycisphaerales bacterium]
MAMNSDQITIRISAFASAAQIMGERTSSVVVPAGSTVDQAWSGLILRHGDLQSLSSTIAFGVNDQLSGRETVLKDGDRLDLLPPVSGG